MLVANNFKLETISRLLHISKIVIVKLWNILMTVSMLGSSWQAADLLDFLKRLHQWQVQGNFKKFCNNVIQKPHWLAALANHQ